MSKKFKPSKIESGIWKLYLTLPWTGGTGTTVIDPGYTPTNNRYPSGLFTISNLINDVSSIALYVGGSLMFFWAIWGVFDYIRAEGNKDGLAKARKKIQWAIVGFIILILSFFVADFLMPLIARSGIGGRPVTPLTQ